MALKLLEPISGPAMNWSLLVVGRSIFGGRLSVRMYVSKYACRYAGRQNDVYIYIITYVLYSIYMCTYLTRAFLFWGTSIPQYPTWLWSNIDHPQTSLQFVVPGAPTAFSNASIQADTLLWLKKHDNLLIEVYVYLVYTSGKEACSIHEHLRYKMLVW